MFGFKKSPANKASKQNSVDTSPFESDNESDKKTSKAKQTMNPARRTSSEPMNTNSYSFDDDDNMGGGGRNKYKNDFRDSGGLENQSVQELENYAVYKSEETTNTVNNCLKIAEDIKGDATKTLDMLHQQGEQITRTHMTAADMDKDLSRGEKILGNLGGMFSKTWKPKKGRDITGPLSSTDNNNAYKKSSNHAKQKEKLGIAPAPKGRSSTRTPPPEPTNALQKAEVEKAKQDDSLSDLSDILGDLKGMAVEMGSEMERQNKNLDHLGDDIDELNSRVKGANQRARRLVGK